MPGRIITDKTPPEYAEYAQQQGFGGPRSLPQEKEADRPEDLPNRKSPAPALSQS